MILWNQNIDENEIMQSDDDILIDFNELIVLNSIDIRKLMVIYKDRKEKNKRLVFITENEYIKDLLMDVGFEKLGVEIREKQ